MHSANRVALFFTLSIALITAASCGGGDGEQTRSPAVRPVKMITLSAASDLQTSRYPAVISAGRFSELSFQVGGLIEEIAVVDAQTVNGGDLIARLDQRDFQSQVSSARAQFQSAEEAYQRGGTIGQGGCDSTQRPGTAGVSKGRCKSPTRHRPKSVGGHCAARTV